MDEDRLYCLELMEHRRVREHLTEDEWLDLEDFEKDEKEAAANKDEASESSSSDKSVDPVTVACYRAKELLAMADEDEGGSSIKAEDDDEAKLEQPKHDKSIVFGHQKEAPAPAATETETVHGFVKVSSVENVSLEKKMVETERKYDGSSAGSSIPARDDTAESFTCGSIGSSDNSEKLKGHSENEDSDLSFGEVDELNELLDRHENGEVIDEDRLYDLDLFCRWQNGEEIASDKDADLSAFQQQRRKERKYRKEYQQLLDRREKGRRIDDARLYNLEMVERRRIGDNLSQEEMSNLLNFEEHETQSTPKAAARKSEVTEGSHLATHHQPRIEHERDGDSRGSGELFHASKGPPHAQPLLTAVAKAGEQADAAEHAEKTEAGNGDGSASDDGSSTSIAEIEVVRAMIVVSRKSDGRRRSRKIPLT